MTYNYSICCYILLEAALTELSNYLVIIYVPGYVCLSNRLDISIQDRSHCTSVASCLVAGSSTAGRCSLETGQQLRVQNVWYLHTNTIISEAFAQQSVLTVSHVNIFHPFNAMRTGEVTWPEDFIDTETYLL